MTRSQAHASLPTLTEVIHITEVSDEQATAPLPLAPDSMSIEDLEAEPVPVIPTRAPSSGALADAVLERLQPRLDHWVQAHIEAAVGEIARELRAELPGLVRDALDEVRQHPPKVR